MLLGKRSTETLKQIALGGSLNVYQIWASVNKKQRGRRSAYQKAVSILLRERLIVVDQKAPWYGKRITKRFRLSIAGLVFLLYFEKDWCKENIVEITHKNKDLAPDLFGLWTIFQEYKVDEIAFKLLLRVARIVATNPPTFPEQIDGRRTAASDWISRLTIIPYDALLENTITLNEVDRWLNMILDNPEADALYENTLRWIIDSHKSALDGFTKLLNKHQEISEKMRA